MTKVRQILKTFLLIFILFAGNFTGSSFSFASAANSLSTFYNYPIPQSLSLCGEPIPLEDQHAREMLDRELTISVWDQAQVFMWLKRSGRYFPYIENELSKAGLPNDLKYLAVAESSLIPYIRSNAGALGVWQFMPTTGERFGLQSTSNLDERRHFEQSTKAAINLLTQLYRQFGSWSLAMAAYNCGEKCVENAIQEQKVYNYYRLSLPRETERFVFRIAAIKLILESPESFGYHLLPEHVYQPVAADMLKVYLQFPLHITDIATELGTDFKMIRELNPHITGNYLPSGEYMLQVPPGKGSKLYGAIAKHSAIAAEKPREMVNFYTVVSGDNLSIISRKTGVSVSQLKTLNGIKGDVVHPGQKLRIR